MSDALVLVTGGRGFVASWCIVELLQRGFSVRATVRDLAQEAAVRAAIARGGVGADALRRLHVVAADLTSDAGWSSAAAGCDDVLHVASPLGHAKDEASFLGPARDGTLRVLRAAVDAGVKRVVMTSAAAAARPPLAAGPRVSDETVWADPGEKRFDAYRRSKILAERAAWDFMAGKPTELVTVLPTAVFGPVLAKDNLGSVGIIAGLLAGKPPALPKFGFVVVDVRDLAKAHVDAMVVPAAAGQRFLAGGDFVWFGELARALRDAVGVRAARVPTREMPALAVKLLAPFVPALRSLAGEVGRRNEVNADKARRVLGFAPRPLATTLVDTVDSLDRLESPGAPR
jgi:nucleoside-diphosphate-sugar epimerase